MGHTRCQRLLKSSLYLDDALTKTETPPDTSLPTLCTLRLAGYKFNLSFLDTLPIERASVCPALCCNCEQSQFKREKHVYASQGAGSVDWKSPGLWS